MSINAIQFQRGLSLPQFQALYGSEQQCERALVAARWPHGWQCAHCGCKRFFHTRNGTGRLLWECFICGYQSSSIVGTVMEHTHLPLRLWFLAMYLLTQNKNAISALALKRQLGVSYKTAWLMKHKLMDETLAAALMISGFGRMAVMAAKECVNRAYEGTLADGVMFERRMFHALFATADQKEGMDAFVNKRAAVFKNQ